MAHHAPRLRPLGVGDLLDETIRLYRSHFLLLAGIVAIVLGPLYLIGDVVGNVVELFWIPTSPLAETVSTGELWLIGIFSFTWAIAVFIGNMAVNLAITQAVSEIYLGGRPTIGSAYSGARNRLGGASGLALLLTLSLALMAVTIVGIPVAIYFGVCWLLSFQALLLEGLGVRASMSRSRSLVRGYWWRTLGIAILLSILGWVISMVVSLPAMILTAIGMVMDAGFAATLVGLLTSLLSTGGTVLVTPIWFCAAVLLYYDLRIRKEGFDLELMAKEMAVSPELGHSPS